MIHRLWFIKVFLLLLHVHFFSLLSFAQKDSGEFSLQLTVTDARTNEKLEFATVSLRDSIRKRQFSTITDTKGMSRLKNIPQGEYQLHISFIGYQKLLLSLVLDRDTSLTLFLTPTATQLKDIIVTASESRGLTSSSRIDRKAMELLQPSSFSEYSVIDTRTYVPRSGPGKSKPNRTQGSRHFFRTIQYLFVGNFFYDRRGSHQHGCQYAIRVRKLAK